MKVRLGPSLVLTCHMTQARGRLGGLPLNPYQLPFCILPLKVIYNPKNAPSLTVLSAAYFQCLAKLFQLRQTFGTIALYHFSPSTHVLPIQTNTFLISGSSILWSAVSGPHSLLEMHRYIGCRKISAKNRVIGVLHIEKKVPIMAT